MIVELIMKRDCDIACLFRKHEAKKIAALLVLDDEHIEDTGLLSAYVDSAPPPLIQSDSESEAEIDRKSVV